MSTANLAPLSVTKSWAHYAHQSCEDQPSRSRSRSSPGLVASGVGRAKPAPSATGAGSYTIAIKDFMFRPRNLTIPVGSKVTWINKDEEPHKVAEVNSTFTSAPLDT